MSSQSEFVLRHTITFPAEDGEGSHEFSTTVQGLDDLNSGIQVLKEEMERVLNPLIEQARNETKRRRLNNKDANGTTKDKHEKSKMRQDSR